MVEIEAESMGKAIIATDLGFSSEAIKNGYNGEKIALGDIAGFSEMVTKLWNAPSLCEEMGKNARKEYEKKYTPEKNYQELIKIYQETYD